MYWRICPLRSDHGWRGCRSYDFPRTPHNGGWDHYAIQLIAAMVETGVNLCQNFENDGDLPQKLINVDVKSKPEISSLPKSWRLSNR